MRRLIESVLQFARKSKYGLSAFVGGFILCLSGALYEHEIAFILSAWVGFGMVLWPAGKAERYENWIKYGDWIPGRQDRVEDQDKNQYTTLSGKVGRWVTDDNKTWKWRAK
jgi:hypothetical protein